MSLSASETLDSLRACFKECWVMAEKGSYWSSMACKPKAVVRVGDILHTHAVEPPSILQLVFSPCCGYSLRLVLPEMLCKLVGDRLGRQEGAVRVKRDNHFASHDENRWRDELGFEKAYDAVCVATTLWSMVLKDNCKSNQKGAGIRSM